MQSTAMPAASQRLALGAPGVLFGLFALWTYEGAFFPLVRPTLAEGAEFRGSDLVARLAAIGVLCGVTLLALRHRPVRSTMVRHGGLLGLIAAYCLLSSLWSLYPATSARRALSLLTCFGFGLFAVAAYGPRGFIRLLGWSLFLAALASFAALPLFGGKVFDNDLAAGAGAIRSFRGVFPQKNALSTCMLIGLCCWAYLGLLQPRRGELERRLWPLALLCIGAALLASRGTTSILAAVLVLLATLHFRLTGWRSRLLFRALLAGAALTGFTALLVTPDLLLALTGKDASLTGRIPLWIESAHAALERPLFGYGYGGFWNPDSAITQYYWARIGWPAANAHDGVLELVLGIGVLGASLYLLLIGRLAWRTLRRLRERRVPEAKFFTLIVVALLIELLDEGTIGWPDVLAIILAFGYAVNAQWEEAARPVSRPNLVGLRFTRRAYLRR